MSAEIETLEQRNTPTRTLNRIYRLANLFLKEAGQTPKNPLLVFHFTFHEDSKVPEPENYDSQNPVDRWYRDHNENVEKMPTSILDTSNYFILQGDSATEVKVILRYTSTDLGYKIPVLHINHQNGGLSRLTYWIQKRMNMSDEEVKREKLREAIESTVLIDYEKILVITEENLKKGKVTYIHNNILEKNIIEKNIDLNNPEISPDFSGTEFNLLSQLMQKFKEHSLPHELKPEGFAILEDYFGKRLPAFDNW